jgi:hypothetical protein
MLTRARPKQASGGLFLSTWISSFGYYGRLDRDALVRIEETIKITLALR